MPCPFTWRTVTPPSWRCHALSPRSTPTGSGWAGRSAGTRWPGSFNYDFGVSAAPEQRRQGGEYNFRHVDEPMEESPSLSVFAINDEGEIFHTYSTYGRGLDPINSGYQLLDLTPKDRDEKDPVPLQN
jgi:predicted dithiol-disulfide oxidoreductase (DUF899 family)